MGSEVSDFWEKIRGNTCQGVRNQRLSLGVKFRVSGFSFRPFSVQPEFCVERARLRRNVFKVRARRSKLRLYLDSQKNANGGSYPRRSKLAARIPTLNVGQPFLSGFRLAEGFFTERLLLEGAERPPPVGRAARFDAWLCSQIGRLSRKRDRLDRPGREPQRVATKIDGGKAFPKVALTMGESCCPVPLR